MRHVLIAAAGVAVLAFVSQAHAQSEEAPGAALLHRHRPDVFTQLSNNVTSTTTTGFGTGGTTTTSTSTPEPKVTAVGLQMTFGGWFLGD
jgi:hypothetical protein